MKLLLANDDGVHASGIQVLYKELKDHFDTTIVAPLEERSTTGHSLSLDRPLRIERLEKNIYGCSGFPADCTLMGLHLLRDQRPDVVVSGINRGANLGQDLYYSGTVAAAREGVFHKVPSIAVSLVFKSMLDEPNYEAAAKIVKACIEAGIHRYIAPLSLLNINVPNLELNKIKGIKLTEIGFRNYSEDIHERVDARGRSYYWIAGLYEGYSGSTESDSHAVENGFASITPHALIDGLSKDYTEIKKVIELVNEKLFS